jgi:Uma2 family endonuclease
MSTFVVPNVPAFSTLEAFLASVDEDLWAEWVDGRLIPMSPVSIRHQKIASFLAGLLQLVVEKADAGLVLSAPTAMRLGDRVREPDLLFVKTARLDIVQENRLDGPADLVVEIVSPESIARDRGEKYVEYEAAGIEEYWLVDPLREQVELYRLDARGRYRSVAAEDGRLASTVITGFWLEVGWLWQEPLPKLRVVAARLGAL